MFRNVLMAGVALFISACSHEADYNYMRAGQPVAEAIARDVSQNWEAEKLIAVADPDLLKDHPEAELRKMISERARIIGPVQTPEALAGEVHVEGLNPQRNAHYIFAIKGANRDARMRIGLVKRGENGKVAGFWVQG